jgi:methylamine dehydrogenase accessory protein MauD
MSTWFLATYVFLWLIVFLLAVLIVALAREFGVLARTGQRSGGSIPAPHDDGPEMGSGLPDLRVSPINVGGTFSLSDRAPGQMVLLMFLSPLCEGCQQLTEVLNDAAAVSAERMQIVAFMRGPELAAKAFLSVFPLQPPVIFDEGNSITKQFNVHNAPFGLLYGPDGKLTRRGAVVNANELAALLGDPTVPVESLAKVYPPPTGSRAQELFPRSVWCTSPEQGR